MVKTMFEHQPERVERVLSLQDSNGHTPLHRASMFDHVDLVRYLLDQVADFLCTHILHRVNAAHCFF